MTRVVGIESLFGKIDLTPTMPAQIDEPLWIMENE